MHTHFTISLQGKATHPRECLSLCDCSSWSVCNAKPDMPVNVLACTIVVHDQSTRKNTHLSLSLCDYSVMQIHTPSLSMYDCSSSVTILQCTPTSPSVCKAKPHIPVNVWACVIAVHDQSARQSHTSPWMSEPVWLQFMISLQGKATHPGERLSLYECTSLVTILQCTPTSPSVCKLNPHYVYGLILYVCTSPSGCNANPQP